MPKLPYLNRERRVSSPTSLRRGEEDKKKQKKQRSLRYAKLERKSLKSMSHQTVFQDLALRLETDIR